MTWMNVDCCRWARDVVVRSRFVDNVEVAKYGTRKLNSNDFKFISVTSPQVCGSTSLALSLWAGTNLGSVRLDGPEINFLTRPDSVLVDAISIRSTSAVPSPSPSPYVRIPGPHHSISYSSTHWNEGRSSRYMFVVSGREDGYAIQSVREGCPG
jgi:hypothetical protein